MNERRAASTIAELDLHLGYVQDAIRSLQASVDTMATKQDFEQLARRMDGLATKAELQALEQKLSGDTVGGVVSRLAAMATKIAVIGAVIGAIITGTVEAIRYFDALQQVRANK